MVSLTELRITNLRITNWSLPPFLIRPFGEGHLKPDFQMPDIKKQIEEKQLGGWGMYLMRTLVDELKVTSAPDSGTTTTMIIYS